MMRAARQANMGKISKDVTRQDNVSDYQVSRFNAVKHGILSKHTREGWGETLEEVDEEYETSYSATADDLENWIETAAKHYFQRQLLGLINRDSIREQAFGDAFEPSRYEPLARYETHLDRKLERTLAMLVKLQELRRDRDVRVLMAIPADEESSSSSDTA